MNKYLPRKSLLCLQNSSVFLFCVMLLAGLTISSQVNASKYTPEGIYDPDIYYLDNGMRVILNERHGARNVAIRLNVGLGEYDFDCFQQETAHFLEHLLFTGTSQHSESDLDEVIIHHGGSWNATAYGEDTVFKIDIFSEYADVGLATLHEIITDSVISKDDFERSQGIIYRELGGVPTRITRFLHQQELVSSARNKVVKAMLKGSRIYCSNLTTLDHISYQDILDAYKQFYVPSNMTLVISGDFDTAETKKQLATLFGKMPFKEIERDIPVAMKFNEGPLRVSSTLDPMFGADGTSELVYRTDGYDSPDYYVLLVIEAYFYKKLYEVIRVQEGLSYSPDVESIVGRNEGLFVISADANLDDMEKVSGIMHKEVVRLRDGKVSDEEINRTLKSLLLNKALGLESNADIAWHYIDNLDEVDRFGRFVDQEALLENITPEHVRTVAQRYLIDSNMAYVKSKPTLTSNQFYLLAGFVFIIIILFSWWLGKSIRFHMQSMRKAGKKMKDSG
jgi:zinc protease